jgi:peptidoglycan LD-endopeptidase LytH
MLRRPIIRVLPVLLLLGAGACSARQASPAVAPPQAPGAVGITRPQLIVPVSGVQVSDLRDSFDAPRSGGRRHLAIDIPAPRGTPVLAAADGVVLKLHEGPAGGIALYHLADDGRTRYYYAHLDGYASGVSEGKRIFQGEVIGFVGDTGNAPPGFYHLHFSVAILHDPRRWWEGDNLNPYVLLKRRLVE